MSDCKDLGCKRIINYQVVYLNQMTIREGTPNDIKAIVELLRQSLGEDLMPKTESFWTWKHVKNPFGASDVLLAFDQSMLVGVRAFMKWEWVSPTGAYKTVRAVDTATHPKYQGKGIFRTLTLALVEKCRSEKVDFIFNTPNRKSKPGYLRMGWKKVGRLPVDIHPVFVPRKKRNDFEEVYPWKDDWLSQFDFATSNSVSTRQSAAYFRWRYGGSSNISYQLVSGDGYGVVFRLKPHWFGTEFRICDTCVKAGAEDRQRIALSEAIKQSGARIVTWSGFKAGPRSMRLSVGPMVTMNPLTLEAMSFKNWRPTLGDMEVF